MIPGKVLFNNESVFTDWFPRGGDNLLIRAQMFARESGSQTVTINLYSKKTDATGDGTLLKDVSGSTFAVVLNSLVVTSGIYLPKATNSGVEDGGMRELVRYKLTVNNVTAGYSAAVRLFPPIFFDAGK